MILELLIIIFLLWIWSGGFNSNLNPNSRSEEILRQLERDLNILFEDSYRPRYRLFVSSERTFVSNKENIYLVLRHPELGYFFDHSTLLQVVIHEMAHILCPDTDHSESFHKIEDDLRQRANRKGLLSLDFSPDPNYPC